MARLVGRDLHNTTGSKGSGGPTGLSSRRPPSCRAPSRRPPSSLGRQPKCAKISGAPGPSHGDHPMIEIRPVTDRRTRRQFIDLPYRMHAGQPHWIPPARLTEVPQFDPKRNPFLADADMDLFMAWAGDRPVGRIAALDDRRHKGG